MIDEELYKYIKANPEFAPRKPDREPELDAAFMANLIKSGSKLGSVMGEETTANTGYWDTKGKLANEDQALATKDNDLMRKIILEDAMRQQKAKVETANIDKKFGQEKELLGLRNTNDMEKMRQGKGIDFTNASKLEGLKHTNALGLEGARSTNRIDEAKAKLGAASGVMGPDGKPLSIPDAKRQQKTQGLTDAQQVKYNQLLDEADYRQETIKNNFEALKNEIKPENGGNWDIAGPKNEKIKALIYEIAVDYAKLVDPVSVAREGEVKAAQIYLLDIASPLMRNQTASDIITHNEGQLEKRRAAMQKSYQAKTPHIPNITRPTESPGKAETPPPPYEDLTWDQYNTLESLGGSNGIE